MIVHLEYENVTDYLLSRFPDLQIDPDYSDLPYMVSGQFSEILLDAFKCKNYRMIVRGFEFIEELYLSGSDKVKELASIGYIETIQNTWMNASMDPEILFPFLGSESKKWWKEINKFWKKEIKYIGETVDSE